MILLSGPLCTFTKALRVPHNSVRSWHKQMNVARWRRGSSCIFLKYSLCEGSVLKQKCTETLSLAAYPPHIIHFISSSFKQLLRSPTHWPPPGTTGWFEVPQRGRSYLWSGKTRAPAVLTIVQLHQHDMILFRNANICIKHALIRRISTTLQRMSHRERWTSKKLWRCRSKVNQGGIFGNNV